MKQARMLAIILLTGITLQGALASETEHTSNSEQSNRPVVAMSEKDAKAIRADMIYTSGEESETLVGKHNTRYELSPHAVVQFAENGLFSLLRGSAIVENRSEASLKTNSARVDFAGRVVVSYDYKEKSTSVFVLAGEARVINPAQEDRTLRLDRFRGASMVVGEVYPQLIRQLDFASVDSWLQGYAWSKERVKELLKELPQEKIEVAESMPEHLQQAKLEDYFSSIDSADDAAPDYYERKFSDPDTQILQANSKKEKKEITPEVAALIALPTNKIDLEFDLPPQVISEKEKRAELKNARFTEASKKGRGIASIMPGSKHAAPKITEVKKPSIEPEKKGDPEINAVLERLRSVRSDDTSVLSGAHGSSRAPASVNTAVPDPVYDYSENF